MTLLRQASYGDFGLIARWLNRPEIRRWLSPDWRAGEISTALIAAVAASSKNKIYLVECGGRPRGAIGLGLIDRIDKTATIWAVLGDLELRGQGTMTEALKTLAIKAFDELGICSINVSLMQPNHAARRICEKAGFQYAGSIRDGLCLDGEPVDRVIYDAVPADFGLDSNAASDDSGVT